MNTHVFPEGNAFSLRLVGRVVLKNGSAKLSTARSEGSDKRGEVGGRARRGSGRSIEPAHFSGESGGRGRGRVADENTGARIDINFASRELRGEIREEGKEFIRARRRVTYVVKIVCSARRCVATGHEEICKVKERNCGIKGDFRDETVVGSAE